MDEAAGPESIFEEMAEGEVAPVEIDEDDLARQAMAAVPEEEPEGALEVEEATASFSEAGIEPEPEARMREGLTRSRRS